jgi:membrane fusion protein, heavy metal efflux system
MNRITIYMLGMIIGFGSCSSPTPEAGPDHAVHDHHHDDENRVELDQQQVASLGITTTTAQMRAMEGQVRLTGRVMASPVGKAQLTSPIGAKVLDVLVEEGAAVKKGQPLIALSDMAFLRMQEDYLVVQAQLERARADLDRQRTLVEGEATARKTFEQARSDATSLEVRHRSLADQLRLLGADVARLSAGTISDRFVLRSPINGRVNNIRVFIDGRVDPATVIMDVIDTEHFHVHLNAFERDLSVLKEDIRFSFGVLNLPREEFVGQIFSIGRSFDADRRSIPVHAHVVKGSERLVEGMSVVAWIPTANAEQMTLPVSAVHRSGDAGYVFMLTDSMDDGRMIFERIAVSPGITAGDHVSFTSDPPMPQGARFAANNVFYLWSMLENEGEHSH